MAIRSAIIVPKPRTNSPVELPRITYCFCLSPDFFSGRLKTVISLNSPIIRPKNTAISSQIRVAGPSDSGNGAAIAQYVVPKDKNITADKHTNGKASFSDVLNFGRVVRLSIPIVMRMRRKNGICCPASISIAHLIPSSQALRRTAMCSASLRPSTLTSLSCSRM